MNTDRGIEWNPFFSHIEAHERTVRNVVSRLAPLWNGAKAIRKQRLHLEQASN